MLYVSSPDSPQDHLPVTFFQYPGGEIGLGPIPDIEIDTITAILHSPESREALGQLKDALDRRGRRDIHLHMPYTPYARQDRAVPGVPANESLAAKFFANYINGMNFKTVWIADPHSDVTPALIEGVRVIPRNVFMTHVFNHLGRLQYDRGDMILLASDAGALKSLTPISREFGIGTIITAEKKRDMATGKISHTLVHEAQKAEGKHVIVPDDICDGGRTFIELAQALRAEVQPASMTLYVTHGIFSKGIQCILEHFDNVFSPYPTPTYEDMEGGAGWGQVSTNSYIVDHEWVARDPVHHTKALTILSK